MRKKKTCLNNQPRPLHLLGPLLLCVEHVWLCSWFSASCRADIRGYSPLMDEKLMHVRKVPGLRGSNLHPHLHLLCQSLSMEGFQYQPIYLQFQKSKYCINDIFNWAMNLAETVLYIIDRKNILMLILSATNHIIKLFLTSLFSSSRLPTVGTFGDLKTVVETLRHCQDACCAYTTPITRASHWLVNLWFIH